MRPLLGTFVEIGVEGPVATAERAVSAAFAIVQRLHSLLSFHEATSDLTRLNQAGGAEIEVHPHTLRVLRLARGMTLTSGGLFNCTLGGAMVQKGVLPDHGGADVLASGDAEDIQISGTRVRLKRPVKITLDGIAKGYAVDCAIAAMKRNGVNTGWVNAGGDLAISLPNASVALSGTVTEDDGYPNPPESLYLRWYRLSGPPTMTFSDPIAANTEVTFTEPGTYILRFTASDSERVGADEVTITVSDSGN